jgi:DME family drug/metabolite transporter
MLAAVLWGTGGVAAKYLYSISNTNPQSLSFLRMAFSVPALAALCALLLGRDAFRIPAARLPGMLLAGLLVALYQVAYFAAIPQVGVAVAALIALCAAPVIVAVLTVFVQRRLPQPVVLLAMALAVAGTVLLIPLEGGPGGGHAVLGIGLALISATLYAINTLLGQRLGAGQPVHPLKTTLVGFAFGALVLLAIAVLSGGVVLAYPPAGWLALAYAGAFTTGVAYALFYSGMRGVPATTASIITLMEPLTTTVLAVALFAEPLGPRTLLGGGLLVAAMLLLLRK